MEEKGSPEKLLEVGGMQDCYANQEWSPFYTKKSD